MRSRALRLCLVTNMDNMPFTAYRPFILKAVQGGVTSIQLREKTTDLNLLFDLAMQFKKLLTPLNIPLIINDHVELAKAVDAGGVHIGQSDLAPSDARKILGPDKIIGLSIEAMSELAIANKIDCIDYVAASAVFLSKTKLNCKTYWGLAGLQQMVTASRHPVMGIGGITAENIAAVMATGACGAAVIGAIHDHEPKTAAEKLITKIDAYLNQPEKVCLKI